MPQKYLNTPVHIFFAVFLPVLLVIGCVKYAERNKNHASVVKNDSTTVVVNCAVQPDTISCNEIKLTSVEFTCGEHKYIMFINENSQQVVSVIHSPNCSCNKNKQ